MKVAYTPLEVKEQDVLQRMIEGQMMYVEVVGWGYHPNPIITAGDKRIQIRFPMVFTKPEGVMVPVSAFILRLKMRDGRTLVQTIESTIYNYQPLMITAGMSVDLVWDIALHMLSEDIQKQILPGIQGKKVMTIQNDKAVKVGE